MLLKTLFNFAILSQIFQSGWISAQTTPAPNQPWLREYDEYRAYEDIYIVKKVNVPGRSYETFITDKNGRRLTAAYSDIGDFAEGLAEFVPMKSSTAGQSMHGFIDKTGKVVIEPKYTSTDRFHNGKTWVIYPSGEHFGLSYIDRTGKEIYKVPIQHYWRDYLIKNAEVRFSYNHNTKEDVLWWIQRPLDFYSLNFNFSPFIEKEIKASKFIYHFSYKGKYGIIDKNMVLKVPVALDDIDPDYKYSGQGMERVRYGDKYGYISQFTGELLVPFEYTDTRKPTGGLFWVKKNDKWGCIDKYGKLRIPHLYDEATGFTAEGRSAVAIDGKFGHIDKSGNVRIPLKYDFASFFNHGISMIRIDNKYGYIDTTGRLITRVIYDEALPFNDVTTSVERSWLRFELSLDGKERFIGLSYKLNALLIMLGTLIFVSLNSLFHRRITRIHLAEIPH